MNINFDHNFEMVKVKQDLEDKTKNVYFKQTEQITEKKQTLTDDKDCYKCKHILR